MSLSRYVARISSSASAASRASRRVPGTSAGDLVLYEGDNVCIFYSSHSWSYTRIGKLDNMSADEVRAFVRAGEGDVSIMLSIHPANTQKQQ